MTRGGVPSGTRARRLALATAWVAGMVAAGGAAPATAQTAPAPEVVADEFLRGFESMAWEGLAQRVHPVALERLHDVITMLVGADARGEFLRRLVGVEGPAAYDRLPAPEVFRRVMESLTAETPGLVHALVTRRHEVVGGVPEGHSVHVVYRVLPRLSGAEPAVKVMTLARDGGPEGPWRVVRADELDVVRSALRGIPVGIAPPPPPDTGRAGRTPRRPPRRPGVPG